MKRHEAIELAPAVRNVWRMASPHRTDALSNNGQNNGWRKLLADEFRISASHLSFVINRGNVRRETLEAT